MERSTEVLKNIYYNESHPASFGGMGKLFRAARKKIPNLKRSTVKDWLRGQDAYTLHRETAQKFNRRRTVVGAPGQQLQADLMDIKSHAQANEGYTFLLTAVDCFSRKAWVVPVRNKTGERVATGLHKILEGQKYFALQTDKGKEFYNGPVRELLSRHGVHHFSSENETIKASLVERFNRTLRARLHRSMTARGSEKILHLLPEVVKAYNDSYNVSIGMSPNEVSAQNQEDVYQRLDIGKIAKNHSTRYTDDDLNVGDIVRITKSRGAFERGFTPNWTRELFRISSVDKYQNPSAYLIEDMSGEEIKGVFYAQELQKVKEPETYAVERIISTRGKGQNKQYLVKWLGYPESFNSWVGKNDIVV